MHTLNHTTRLRSPWDAHAIARGKPAARSARRAAGLPRAITAFTLVELLVTIGIIVLVIGLTIPALSVMQNTSRTQAGFNTVSVAVEAARQLATRESGKQDPISEGGSANGTAVLFTNTGTVRLLKNDPTKGSATLGDNQKAYVDIPGRQYISIPSNVGIVGIRRTGNNLDGLKFVAPPFALRFNRHANLIYGNQDTNGGAFNVYYDGNYDNTYDNNDDRPTGYDPSASANRKYNTTEGKYQVPFERIQSVAGVMVFDAGEVSGISAQPGKTYINDQARDRILKIGRAVFFSRYTGAPLRGGKPRGQ